MNREAFAQECDHLGIKLAGGQLDLFKAFEDDLYAMNASVNLTRVDKDECWIRHFLDSLLFHDLIPSGSKVLDIGTGPGFPAWPLAVARPDLSVLGLDSSGKMLGFLERHPLPNLEIVQGRAEEWGVQDKFDVVTGRALAPLSIQLEVSVRAAKVKGCILPMRTPSDRSEIERLRENPLALTLETVEEKTLPIIDAPRLFPVFRKVRRTSQAYPRTWSLMRKKPI